MPLIVRIVLLGLLAIFSAPVRAEAPVYFGLSFPDSVAGFPRGDVRDFEKDHPGLGYGVKYNKDNTWLVDVFIYDDGFKDLPDSLSADVVVKQFDQARGDIYTNQKNNHGKVQDKGRFTIAGPDKKPRFSCGVYLIETGTHKKIDSFLCLTVWKGKFVKYRLSTLTNSASTDVAKRFVGAWTKILWP